MAPKIFMTGGTGYIGGTVLDTIATQHPEYEIIALLRSENANFVKKYPTIKIVQGDYDSFDIVAGAAAAADVVVHCGDSDHKPSIRAILSGLQQRGTPSSPAFLIHLSGSGIVADWREEREHGTLNPKVWSDVADIESITNRPVGELHQHVDALIHDFSREHGDSVKTAIMCPPDIYGPGRGPGRTRTVYFPAFIAETKRLGYAFYSGNGENTRSWVHIEDLARLYLRLVEAAVAGGNGADWGAQGYYFASTQEASQKEVAIATGKILKRLNVPTDDVPRSVPLDVVDPMLGHYGIPNLGRYLFAANSRTRAERAHERFGYGPTAPTLFETLEADLKDAVAGST